MHTAARRSPFRPIALAASVLAAFLILVSPLSASAHDALTASSPEADSSVATLPSELTLTFSADLLGGEGSTEVVVMDADENSVTDGDATVSGPVVTQPLVSAAAAGEYHVIWKVVSSDGHPISGEYYFTVTEGTPAAESTSSPAPETAAPTAEASPAPVTSDPATPADGEAESAAPTIWIVSILGALVVVALVVWLTLRSRRNARPTDSDRS